MQFQPPTPKTIEQMRGGFLRAMSDAGLKPTVVYHNLTPAELYEMVCLLHSFGHSSEVAEKSYQDCDAAKRTSLCNYATGWLRVIGCKDAVAL